MKYSRRKIKRIIGVSAIIISILLINIPSVGYADEKAAELQTGSEVNAAIKALTGTENDDAETSITAFKWNEEAVNGTEIQTSDSEIPVYIKLSSDGTTVYVYSEASTIYANEDASGMFKYLTELSNVEEFTKKLDVSKTVDVSDMFEYCSGLRELNLMNLN